MPAPVKPCPAQFSETTIESLIRNQNREQWIPQKCELCGQSVGARQLMGKWIPEPHWPSVRYLPRTRPAQSRAGRKPTPAAAS